MLRCASRAGLAAALVFATTGLARAAPLQVEIILDMSGSMAYPLTATDRRPKVELARQAVLDLAIRLPRDAQVGLTLYGHNPLSDKASSCADIVNVVPLGGDNSRAITDAVTQARPYGLTPLTAALRAAFERLRGRPEPRRIILVSDGVESCGGDPCAAVRDLRASGIDVTFDVVGVGLPWEARPKIVCIAQAGGGQYFDVTEPRQFRRAIERLAVPSGVPAKGAALMDTATLVAIYGFLALMVERVTNAVAILL